MSKLRFHKRLGRVVRLGMQHKKQDRRKKTVFYEAFTGAWYNPNTIHKILGISLQSEITELLRFDFQPPVEWDDSFGALVLTMGDPCGTGCIHISPSKRTLRKFLRHHSRNIKVTVS